ncbi:MAG: chorismate mutase [Alphaproteobacteria bacterium]|nr:chorismate mutase [Alphaproteobacteria bacterium]
MANPSPLPVASKLEDLRAEIDAIDDELLDLLERRIAIGRRVADAKGPSSGPFLRPGREAAILRRLAAAPGGLDVPVLERVWREILAANLARQIDPIYAVWAPEGAETVADLARARGGVSTEIRMVADAAAALSAITVERATLAVLPCPTLTRWRWWPQLLIEGLARPRIVARLPLFGDVAIPAVCVAGQDPDPSGDDDTLYAVPGSISGALDVAPAPRGGVWSLMVTEGFVGPASLPTGARVVGAYARPGH